jgi:hypothetical protein
VVALAAVVAMVSFWAVAQRSATLDVRPGQPVTEALRSAPGGATIRLLPGSHGPFVVDRAVTVVGAPGAVAQGPVTVTADGAVLSDLTVQGGESGVSVQHAAGVVLKDVAVSGAELHGIEVSDGSAAVRGCRISGLTSPFAQGFEIRNSTGLPRTVVEGCSVSGGQEGLVSHVSRVEFNDNHVSGTTLRAISVTEMSEGLARGNRVDGATGIGLYCGDMSHCDFQSNMVTGVGVDEGGSKQTAGYGAVAWYYSTMRVDGNVFDVAAPHPTYVSDHSATTIGSPLALWPRGWTGALPSVGVGMASLAGLALVSLVAWLWVRRRRPVPGAAAWGRLDAYTVVLLVAGFGVASAHMLEHVVQVYQVYVADAEFHSGLLGMSFDTEWLHFAYNSFLLLFTVWVWWLVRPGRGPARELVGRGVTAVALAVVAVQSYHLVEHTAKIVQHYTIGARAAPGIFGGQLGLVFFHFGINLAVWTGLLVVIGTLVGETWRRVAARPSPEAEGVPVAA